MSIWSQLFASRRPTNPGRELNRIGYEKRRASVKEVARQMRAELGLPPHEALQ